MFKTIMNAIQAITPGIIGSTGYLDGIRTKTPSKGVDSAQRPFFSLPLLQKVTTEMSGSYTQEDTFTGVLTFFQRYTGRADFWTTAGDDGFIAGGLKEDASDFLEPILLRILSGEEVTVEIPKKYHGWVKKTLTVRLLNQEECTWNDGSKLSDQNSAHTKQEIIVTQL